MNKKHKNAQKIRDKLPSNLILDKFQEEIRKRQKDKSLQNFQDPYFQHNYNSLINSDYNILEYKQQFEQYDIIWYRIDQIFQDYDYDVFRDIKPEDVIQGQLPNCYLMCSISCLAEFPKLVSRLFDIEQANLYGIYSIWLNINGLWQQILLDDYFPCIIDINKNIKFLGCSNNDNELWVLLIEKAYAKIHGSYWSIARGNPIQTLRELTGAPYRTFYIDNQNDNNNIDIQQKEQLINDIWQNIYDADLQDKIIVTGTKQNWQNDKDGLKVGHAYSVLQAKNIIDSYNIQQRILQIRNPYGKFEWTGDFSDNCKRWTKELKQQLNIEKKDDGIFWMKIEDFINSFGYVGILDIEEKSFLYSRKIYQKKNQQQQQNQNLLKIQIQKDNIYTFSIDQMSERYMHNKDYKYSYFRMTLFQYVNKNNNNIFKYIDTIYDNQQSIFLKNKLEKGEYYILIETEWQQNIIQEYTFGYYSQDIIQYEEIQVPQEMIKDFNYYIWKDCIEQNNFEYEKSHDLTISKKTNESIQIKEFQIQNANFYVFDNTQNSKACYLKLTYSIKNSKLVCQKSNDCIIKIFIDKFSTEYIACFDKTFFEKEEAEFEFQILGLKHFSYAKILNNQQRIKQFIEEQTKIKKQNCKIGPKIQKFNLQKLSIEFREKQLKALFNNDKGQREDLQRKLSSTVDCVQQSEAIDKSQNLQIQKDIKKMQLKTKRKKSFNQINHIQYNNNQKIQEKQTYQQSKNYQFSQNKKKEVPVTIQSHQSYQQPITQNFINNLNIVKQDSLRPRRSRFMSNQQKLKNRTHLVNQNKLIGNPNGNVYQRTQPIFEYQQISDICGDYKKMESDARNVYMTNINDFYQYQDSYQHSQISDYSGTYRPVQIQP